MKNKILPLLGGLLLLAVMESRADVIDATISRYGTPAAVSISTSAYVKICPSATLTNATGLLIDNPSTNTGIVHGHLGNKTSTSVSISTVKGPIEIAPSTNGGVIPIGPDTCVWIVSRHTSAESVTYQAVSQRYGF